MPRNVQAALFDVGGVLQLPDHSRVRQALGAVLDEVPEERIDQAHYAAVAQEEGWDGMTKEVVRYDGYLRSYLAALGVPSHRTEEAVEHFDRHLGDGSGWTRVVPGAPQLLRALERRSIRLAIVSNTLAGGVESRLRAAGVCQVGTGSAACVAAVVDSHLVGVRKPAPEIFQAALRAVGTDPSETIFVGDELQADVRGAQAVGIAPIHFDPLGLCPLDDHAHARALPDVARRI